MSPLDNLKLSDLTKEMKQLAHPKKAQDQARFFKTGKGEYGEGDVFIGIKVPDLRKLSRKYKHLDFKDLNLLIKSKKHEERQIALFILTLQYQKADRTLQTKIYNYYLKNLKYINNWDLVDGSTPHIVGHYLKNKDKEILYTWAQTNHLWKKRMAIMATFDFIRNHQFADTLKIAQILLNDPHDLIHKAVGWMLREVGNRHETTLHKFLKHHYQQMPRTMLRYAIEKIKEDQRQDYLKGRV